MSPLRRHIFVCFMAKSAFRRGYTTSGDIFYCSDSRQLNHSSCILFVCLYVCCFVCPSRYDARHRKPRRCVYALNLGGTGISPPDKSPPGQKTPRTKAPTDKNPPGQKCPRAKDPRGKVPPWAKDPPDKSTPGQKSPNKRRHNCSGSRQLNHSSLILLLNLSLHN